MRALRDTGFLTQVEMRIFKITLDTNVLYAQAFGCWLYVQLGCWGLFCGRHMPWGIRVELHERRQRVCVRHFLLHENNISQEEG